MVFALAAVAAAFVVFDWQRIAVFDWQRFAVFGRGTWLRRGRGRQRFAEPSEEGWLYWIGRGRGNFLVSRGAF